MLRRRISSFAMRFFCLLLAFHFLNLSIDSADRDPDSVPEDLSFNDIESLTEFFAEVVFNFSNTFQEHDEHDANDKGAFDVYKFYSIPSITYLEKSFRNNNQIKYPSPDFGQISSPDMQVSSPPPKG